MQVKFLLLKYINLNISKNTRLVIKLILLRKEIVLSFLILVNLTHFNNYYQLESRIMHVLI